MEDEPNTPRVTFDRVLGWALNFFAAIGVTSFVAFFVGYFWSR